MSITNPAIGNRTPIWLDCDPGHDDAFAIILCAKHPSVKLLGISTIHGNASVEKCTQNALSVLTAIGETKIPVYTGSSKPFMRPAVHAPSIHGSSGIDGTDLLPEPICTAKPGNAIVAMRDAIMSTTPQTCCLVVTGTMTNAALLFATFPEAAKHIKSVSIMGGSFRAGNITKFAEFNIFCDPESANALFTLPALSHKLILCPLDITHTVLATPTILSTLKTSTPTVFRTMLHDLLTFFADNYARVFNITAGPPLHDPLAVAAMFPDVVGLGFKYKETTVEIVLHGAELGRTKLSVRQHDVEEGLTHGLDHTRARKVEEVIVRVAEAVDVDEFWNVMMAAIDRADVASPLNH